MPLLVGPTGNTRSVKANVLPYSLPRVGSGADPGVQGVSPQVTF